MCYAGGTGFGGYAGYGGYHRRVRVFEIDTNEARITTWKRLEYGDIEAQLDKQKIVDGGKAQSKEDADFVPAPASPPADPPASPPVAF